MSDFALVARMWGTELDIIVINSSYTRLEDVPVSDRVPVRFGVTC
jgi:hypothetical protein